MGSTPVASGSRLPVWPAFSRPNTRRTRCTAALELSPRGLSSSRIPCGKCESPEKSECGTRGGAPVSLIVARLVGSVDQRGEVRRAVKGVIGDELQPRCMPQAGAPADLATQESRGRGQSLLHLGNGGDAA